MFDWLQNLIAQLRSLTWEQQLLVGGGVFVVSFLASLAVTIAVIVRIPADYFVDVQAGTYTPPHPVVHWLMRIGRNLLGVVIVLIGVFLSLPGIPGQGVLTILIGLMLLDFPGKRRMEIKLARRPLVRRSLDRLRARFGKPPLEMPDETADEQPTPPDAALFGALLTAVILIAGLIVLEVRLGSDYSLLAFYLVPFFLLSWYVGRTAGVWLSALTALAWIAVHIGFGVPLTAMLLWNALVRLALFVAVTYGVTGLKNGALRERELTRADGLTGIANVRHFIELANREIARAHRNQQPFTVVYLDIDRFKDVNARFGHTIGDDLLRGVAQTIRDCIRETDVLARIGGDEFILLLPETGLEPAQAACRKVQQKLRDYAALHDWPVGFTLGVLTCLQPPACTPQELIKLADDLMDSARKEGKDRIKHDILNQPSPQPARLS